MHRSSWFLAPAQFGALKAVSRLSRAVGLTGRTEGGGGGGVRCAFFVVLCSLCSLGLFLELRSLGAAAAAAAADKTQQPIAPAPCPCPLLLMARGLGCRPWLWLWPVAVAVWLVALLVLST
jgi:hypothetical protein